MTLKELKRRHESGEKQMKTVKAQIKQQLSRKCAQRGCDESLAFRTRTKVLCDKHRGKPLEKAVKSNSKKRPVKRRTKTEVKRLNKIKRQRFYDRHGIKFDKTVRKRKAPVSELAVRNGTAMQFAGQTLLYEDYKEPLRKIEPYKGYGYYGTIAMTTDKMFIQCHICGNLYANLGGHLRLHKIKATKYKETYGLNISTALISEPVRELMQKNQIKPFNGELPAHLVEYNRKVQSGEIKHRGNGGGKGPSLEWRNKNGLCPDQVLERIRELADKLGHVPSHDEFRDHYNYRYLGAITFQHGSYSEAVRKLGMTPRGEARKYTKERLLEALVEFKEKHGRIPMTSDFNRGLLPAKSTYFYHFGTLNNARVEAGLNAVLPMPFGQIVELTPAQYADYLAGRKVEHIKESGQYKKRKAKKQLKFIQAEA